MAKDDAGPGSCVIIVGEPDSELVQTLVRLARDREIDAVPCAHAYAAVVALARTAGRRVFVAGRIKELAIANGGFFALSAAHAARCCCLLHAGKTPEPEDLLAAVRANATMVGAVTDVRTILEDWLAAAPQDTPRPGRGTSPAKRSVREDTYEDLRATEAELSALLG